MLQTVCKLNLLSYSLLTVLCLCVSLQDGLCELADKPIVNNNYLPYVEELLSAPVVKSQQSAAVSVEADLPIPVIDNRVVSPGAELFAELHDDRRCDIEQCRGVITDTVVADTRPMSIPVLISSPTSPLKRCNQPLATHRPLMAPANNCLGTIPPVIGQSRWKQAVTKDSRDPLSVPCLVKPARDVDQASTILLPCADRDMLSLTSQPLSKSLTPLPSMMPLVSWTPVCPLPSFPFSVPAGHLPISLTGVSTYPSKEIECENVLKTQEPIAILHSGEMNMHGSVMNIHGSELVPAVVPVILVSRPL